MNSTLQMLYMMPQVRQAVSSIKDFSKDNESTFTWQLKVWLWLSTVFPLFYFLSA